MAAPQPDPTKGDPRMRTLVTGGAGFIGSALVDRLVSGGHEVTVVDSLSSGRLENLADAFASGRCHLAEVDIAGPGLAAAVAELRPGVSERELTGVFMDAMATRGVTTPATQDVVRITTARAAREAGGDGRVQAGDLVAFDAGVVADGYAGETGRTWPVEPNGTAGSLGKLYERWERLWERLLEACRPGATGSGLLEAYGAAGEPLPQRPIGRGLGLGFDDPVIVGDLPATAANERLDPGVVLVVTGCVTDDRVATVTAHEAVLITPDGAEVLSGSPFWNR